MSLHAAITSRKKVFFPEWQQLAIANALLPLVTSRAKLSIIETDWNEFWKLLDKVHVQTF